MTRTSLFLIAAFTAAAAQPTAPRHAEPFALPTHPGAMMLDLTGFRITEASAKPGGREIGIRAHDTAHTEFLALLFLTPEQPHETPAACLEQDLVGIRRKPAPPAPPPPPVVAPAPDPTPAKSSKSKSARAKTAARPAVKPAPAPLPPPPPPRPAGPDEQLDPDGTDTPDVASILLTFPNGNRHLYKYSGSGDQCVSFQAYPDKGATLDLAEARSLLARQSYIPNYAPTPTDVYTYAGILYRTKQYQASIPVYQNFLAVLPLSKDNQTARRVATDNMGMALDKTGDVNAARRLFTDAIHSDSGYPLYYYNLACADAEQGDAKSAKSHLQQAFQRRKNLLPGESLPNPTTDDSLLKLKNDQQFWSFVQSLK